ncbi:MAG: type II methionyl aminopeptidase [Nitrososphaerales archaeon]
MVKLSIAEEYFKAGKIASEVKEKIKGSISVGSRLVDIAEMVEQSIIGRGAHPAFPCNICLNSVAAHYTPRPEDDLKIREGDVVKIDFGVHIDGYVVDTAITLSFNVGYDAMVRAVEVMLQEALKVVKVGVKAGEVGRAIQAAAQRLGFKPIVNLSGHAIAPYTVHAGLSIPNTYTAGTPSLKLGQVYAIEPFATTQKGAGVVVNGPLINIFSLVARKPLGDPSLDAFVEELWARFRTLPFTYRQIRDLGDAAWLERIVKTLMQKRVLRGYPMLVEARNEIVAQAEHTVTPVENGVVILTE